MEISKDRQVRWTTFVNISSWFDSWEFDLVDLGFATRGINGAVTIPNDQLPFILNFDETCLLLDGSEGRRGGRPVIMLHDPRFPYNGKQMNKDGLMATLVCGSNAAEISWHIFISVHAEHYCGNARDELNLWGVQEPV